MRYKMKSIRDAGGHVKCVRVPLTEAEEAAADAAEQEHQRGEGARLRRAMVERRLAAYPPIGDQLDAIWKHLNYRRTQGDELIQEADDILGKVLAVKRDIPLD